MLAGLVARVRSLWRALRGRRELETDMAEEFRLHLELRTADLVRLGLSPEDAARRARLEFGHIRNHKDDARDARGLRLFDQLAFSWLDVKLGLRMLAKYPGLSLVAVVGMSVAVAIAAGAFGFITSFTDPTLPLDQDERVVSILKGDPDNSDRRLLHDFVQWRDEVQSVRDLSAYTSDRRNLVIPDRGVELVRIAQMTASGFRVARVAPVLGRPLLDDDERESAPPVIVIAHEEWQRRFDGDPGIVGRLVRLGGTVHQVVGVMPEGFGFPVNHRYWVPLKLDPTDYQPGGGPSLFLFGRLADGATLEQAQAELTVIGLRTAAAETHEHLRPRVLRYTHAYIDSPGGWLMMRAVSLIISLLLVVVAVNVAVLVYARTATRAGEIAVRTALGASRRRIVAQLFAEALVLSGTAAALGLAIARAGLGLFEDMVVASGAEPPYWMTLGLSPGLVAYVAGLALLAGVIVGVVPALKATGRRVQAGLQQLSSRGSQMQLGRMWAAMIVSQVAVAVAALPHATHLVGMMVQRGTAQATYPVDQFLRAYLSMERDEAPPAAEAVAYQRALEHRFRQRVTDLLRRLEAEPAVAGATFATHFPGGGAVGRIEVEGPAGRTTTTSLINQVDVNLFNLFGMPILAGRGFVEGDAREGSNVAIVNRAFAERVLVGSTVVGHHIRLVSQGSGAGRPDEIESGPWLEIVGMVPDFLATEFDLDLPDPGVYQPMNLAQAPPPPTLLTLAIRVREGPPAAFAGRLRSLTAAVDPALQLHELKTATEVERDEQRLNLAMALLAVAVTGSVLLLSAAGIYAMMSFTVARRRREIGIRQALGADPRRLLAGIFSRASAQLGLGVLTGLVLAVAVSWAGGSYLLTGRGVALVALAVALMVTIGLLAALGPARRGLAVQPTEALKEE